MTEKNININFGFGSSSLLAAVNHLAFVIEEGFKKMEVNTQALVQAVTDAATKLATEIQEVADTIAGLHVDNSAAQGVIDEQVARLNQLATDIENIVPTPSP